MTIPIVETRQGDLIFKGTKTTTIICEDCGSIWARVKPGQRLIRCCRPPDKKLPNLTELG